MFSSIEILKKNVVRVVMALMLVSIALACEVDDPAKEDAPELVTQVTLTFTPTSGEGGIIVTATDPDGEGVQDIQVDTPIKLKSSQRYVLTITLLNGLIDASEPGYNITDEVEEEGDEHMFFFAWTNNIFNDPPGDGNADSRADAVNYVDEDVNGLPLGLLDGSECFRRQSQDHFKTST